MKTKGNLIQICLLGALALATVNSQLSTAHAQTTAFTYQGQLNSGDSNANGSYDLQFAVYDANVAGNLVAGPVTNAAIAVSNGLFTVTLDFGAGVFTGTNYWVEMGVRTNGGAGFATLVPRQQLTPAPYAIYAPQAGHALSLSAQSPQINALCPPGSVMGYAGSAAPTGWLLCDGSLKDPTQYPALFTAIGITYGGNGTTTFGLPDIRGRAVVGAGTGSGLSTRSLGQTLGKETHILTAAEMPSHTHSYGDPGHSHAQYVSANSGGSALRVDYNSDVNGVAYPQGISTGPAATGITINSAGDGGAHTNMQPSLVLNYIIKF